jgi:predicted  nucleic acid-binding Zn-ribbon protein
LFNRLKVLYELQLIDDQLDELEELRGDLPNAVKALEEIGRASCRERV